MIGFSYGFSYGFCQSMVVPMVFPSMFINFLWIFYERQVRQRPSSLGFVQMASAEAVRKVQPDATGGMDVLGISGR